MTTSRHGLSMPRFVLVLMTVAAWMPCAAQSVTEIGRFQEEIDRFRSWDAKNSSPPDAVLFIGSSTIRLWETASLFPRLRVVNRGFGGAQISDVLDRLVEVLDPHDPSVIVFYTGDNDVADGKSAEQVRDDFQHFIDEVRRRKAGTPVIFLAIKPSLNRWALWPEMKRANEMISELASNAEDVFFVDLAAITLNDAGTPRPEFFVDDGLHLSEEGYAAWSALLADVLTGMLDKNGAYVSE